jgi:hypothetical protein
MNDPHDEIRPVRGVLVALALVTPFWLTVGLVVREFL